LFLRDYAVVKAMQLPDDERQKYIGTLPGDSIRFDSIDNKCFKKLFSFVVDVRAAELKKALLGKIPAYAAWVRRAPPPPPLPAGAT
jgi:hypothetical protein